MRLVRLPLVQTAVLIALLAIAASACASERVAFEQASFSPFGSFSYPTGIAVDPSTEEVLVADGNPANIVDIFGLEGDSLPLGSLTGTGSESFSFGHEFAGVAVDNDPASASFHDVYISDVEHGVVDKFRRTGPLAYEYVCQFNGWHGAGEEACHVGGGVPEEPFREPLGVAVDAQGDVYIASFEPGTGAVDEFDSSGKGVIRVEGAEHGLLIGHPQGVAVDSIGDIFVLNYQSGKRVVELRRTSLTGGVESEQTITSPGTSIAIDPSNDDLYVDFGLQIAHYTQSGPGDLNLAGEFSGSLGDSLGVAVNGAMRTIYASDAGNLDASAFLAKTIVVPDVRGACAVMAVTATAATLSGEVNPLGTEGAQYTFEYGPEGFEHQMGGTVEGTGFKPVSAELSGLEPGRTYRCRLGATNTEALAGGLVNYGPPGTFETLPLLPIVDELPAFATEVTTESAILNGFVNPDYGPTVYHFVIGPRANDYTQELPSVGIGSGTAPIPVEQAIPYGLSPNTTYHFALIAINKAGLTPGPDETFHTPSNGTPPEMPPVVSTTGAESITPTSATLTATVYPEDTPTSYFFEFGSDTNYGTTIYGGEAGSERGSAQVSQAVAGLQPGVTYHYRVVAFNAAGSTTGVDRSFTTPPTPRAASCSRPHRSCWRSPSSPSVKIPVPKPPKHKKKKAPRPRRRRTKRTRRAGRERAPAPRAAHDGAHACSEPGLRKPRECLLKRLRHHGRFPQLVQHPGAIPRSIQQHEHPGLQLPLQAHVRVQQRADGRRAGGALRAREWARQRPFTRTTHQRRRASLQHHDPRQVCLQQHGAQPCTHKLRPCLPVCR